MSQPILVVEDDAELRALLVEKLKGTQNEIIEASDGLDAVEKFKQYKPRIVVLDLMLPKADGFAVMQEINKEQDLISAAQIVIYSNYADGQLMAKAKEYNVADYMVKAQATVDMVYERVKALLEMTL